MRVVPSYDDHGPLVLIVAPSGSLNALHEYTPDEARQFATRILAAANAVEDPARTAERLEGR